MTKITKDDLLSADVAGEKLKMLRDLFPDAFSEGVNDEGRTVPRVDCARILAEIGLGTDAFFTRREYYGLDWPGKTDCVKLIQQPSLATLKPCPEESVDFDTTENLFIEGDNLEVLKLLQKSYFGKVKMIYIDPPYNTGKDFVYPDDFAEPLENYLELTGQKDALGRKLSANAETAGRFHTNWLNMMFPRLYLARNLLREDGVIFISIDDHEVANLKHLCNELFGEENFVAQFIWKSKLGKVGTTSTISVTHEYILCFAKYSEHLSFRMIEKDHDGRRENLRQWGQADRREDRPSMYYPIVINGIKVYPIKEDGTEGRWRVGQETADELLEKGVLELAEKNGRYEIYRNFCAGLSVIPYDTLLLDEVGTTAKGANTLRDLGLHRIFDYSKPVELVRFFQMLAISSNDIILDFFSGSATTAHAVMQLNAEDGGNRKFILVQLPEPCDESTEAFKAGYKTIAEIGKERIRRVGERIVSSLELQVTRKENSENGSSKLSTVDRLAEGDGLDGGNLSSGQDVAQRGTLFPLESDETCRRIDSVKHRGRKRSADTRGISTVSSNSQRLSSGTGDTTANMRASRIHQSNGNQSGDGDTNGNKQNAHGSYEEVISKLKVSSYKAEAESPLETCNSKLVTDTGFRVFKLDRSNFRVWDGAPGTTAEQLFERMAAIVDPLRDGTKPEELLYEILLKAGFSLSSCVKKIKIAGKTVYVVEDDTVLLCLENEVTKALIDEVIKLAPARFYCLDKAFKKNDQLKVNTIQQFVAHNQDRGGGTEIIFRVI